MGEQAEETREQRQARQHAREEREKEALALLGLPWQEPTRKGAGRPTFKDCYFLASAGTAHHLAGIIKVLSSWRKVQLDADANPPGPPGLANATESEEAKDYLRAQASAVRSERSKTEQVLEGPLREAFWP